MQRAVAPGAGAMAALLGVELDQAAAICAEAAEGEVVEVANDNGGGQVVISGAAAAVERAIALARAKGVKRALLLPVSAPFHCALMAPAADAMAKALAAEPPRAPLVPVVANVTAAPVSDPVEIRDLLVQQVTATVRWRESVAAMKAEGVDTVVELGAGKVLAGLVKRIDPEIAAGSVGTPAEIEAFLKTV
jgi:[acyl-carrier-protein] S-malonyltransferase